MEKPGFSASVHLFVGESLKSLLSFTIVALTLPFYLRWVKEETERQIDQMQADAFSTPGVQGPITGPIGLVTVALLFGYGIWSRLLGLRAAGAISCLVIGVAAGIGAFWWRSEHAE
jgi:hypothetical protein